jgi:hypothetical protein
VDLHNISIHLKSLWFSTTPAYLIPRTGCSELESSRERSGDSENVWQWAHILSIELKYISKKRAVESPITYLGHNVSNFSHYNRKGHDISKTHVRMSPDFLTFSIGQDFLRHGRERVGEYLSLGLHYEKRRVKGGREERKGLCNNIFRCVPTYFSSSYYPRAGR